MSVAYQPMVIISVVDPDPDQHGSALTWLSWICIENEDPDPNPGARKLTKK
jgi:hypothetical protein